MTIISHRVDQQETHRRVIALFQRHPELIEGYAVFIPPGHTIDIPADPRGNVFVTVPTGTMEIARDGTVVNDAHMMTAPELQRQETEASGLSEQKKRLLETLRARIADSEEEEFKAFLASFEANLTISPEQKKVRSTKILPETRSLISCTGFTRCWSGSRVRGEAPGTSRG